MFVCFDRADRSAFQVKTVKGRVQILPVDSVSTRSDYSKTGMLTFCSVVILQHLNVGVIRETVLADRGEVGCFPTGAVEILLDLRRHDACVLELEQQCLVSLVSCNVVYKVESEDGGGALICLLEPSKFCNQLYRELSPQESRESRITW